MNCPKPSQPVQDGDNLSKVVYYYCHLNNLYHSPPVLHTAKSSFILETLQTLSINTSHKHGLPPLATEYFVAWPAKHFLNFSYSDTVVPLLSPSLPLPPPVCRSRRWDDPSADHTKHHPFADGGGSTNGLALGTSVPYFSILLSLPTIAGAYHRWMKPHVRRLDRYYPGSLQYSSIQEFICRMHTGRKRDLSLFTPNTQLCIVEFVSRIKRAGLNERLETK